jgi:hypothetical protein
MKRPAEVQQARLRDRSGKSRGRDHAQGFTGRMSQNRRRLIVPDPFRASAKHAGK